MKIVKRIKNKKGMTIAYMIDNDGIISRYTADDTYNLSNLITNAVLVGKSKNDFYFRSSYSPYFRNLLHHHISTREDLYRYYKLDKIENRDSFLIPNN